MADLTASIAINLAGDLQRRARLYGGSLEKLGQRGQRAFRAMNGAAGRAMRSLTRMGSSTTGLLAGGGLVAGAALLARRTMQTGERLERLGIQSKTSSRQVRALWDDINAVASLKGIKADPKEVLSAVEQIVEKTGDLKFARDNLKNLATAIQATGASGDAIGGIAAELQKMGLVKPDEVIRALDILNEQGKAGAFTLQNLAALGPRVITAYTATGRGGLQAIREMGAALQVIRQGTGSSEMAATAFEALMRTLQDADKIKLLQQGGIQVFDPEKLKQGEEEIRAIDQLMVEIIQRAGGKNTVLSKIFDAEALRAFNTAQGEYKRTGKVELLDMFMAVRADSGQTAKDAARAAATASAKVGSATGKLEKSLEDLMAGPVDRFSEAVDKLVSWDVRTAFPGLNLGSPSGPKTPPAAGGVAPGASLPVDHQAAAFVRWVMGLFAEAKNTETPGAATGRVTIEVQAVPGTRARVKRVEGRGIDADSGVIMQGH